MLYSEWLDQDQNLKKIVAFTVKKFVVLFNVCQKDLFLLFVIC